MRQKDQAFLYKFGHVSNQRVRVPIGNNELKWYNCVVMKMDDYKISDNFQRTEGRKVTLPHHFHLANGDPRIRL